MKKFLLLIAAVSCAVAYDLFNAGPIPMAVLALGVVTNRQVQDAALSTTVAGPNGATGANSSLLDLGQTTLFPVNEAVDVEISIPAAANQANTKVATYTLIDSADNNASNANAITGISAVTVTADANGGAATTAYRKLPGGTRRYLGLRSSGEVNGNNIAAISATLKVLS